MTTPFDPRQRTRSPFEGRSARTLASLLLVLLAVDFVLGLALPEPTPPVLPESFAEIRETLQRASDSDDAWLLVGDSVLAGDVMRGKVERWEEHRVVDYMRREMSADRTVDLEQVALDGMLPVDMVRILRELDSMDPEGEVGVVVEINPRFFSVHYAAQTTCSREVLCELGPPMAGPWAWVGVLGDALSREVLDVLPLARHRHALPSWDPAELAVDVLAQEATAPAQAELDALEGKMRILEHYRRSRLDDASVQVRALREVVARLRRRHRRALFFATPLSDGFMRGTLDGERYGDLIERIDRWVTDGDHPQIRFVSLDHPVFTDPEFLDHAHMGPAGNQRLAINLLHELGIGLRAVPDRFDVVYPEGPDATLVARIEHGYANGAPWQAMMDGPTGLDVSADGRRVVIADTGNHCLREIAPGGVTLRRLAGQPGRGGSTDGPTAWARVTSPRSPVILGDAVYFLDGADRKLRKVEDGRVTTIDGGRALTFAQQLRTDGEHLYVRNGRDRIVRFDPDTGQADVLVTGSPGEDMTAFDVTSDGHILVADSYAAIWEWAGPARGQIGRDPKNVTLRFGNIGETPLPQDDGDYYPFEYERMSLYQITALEYVEAYGGVLVADESPGPEKVTGRVHLRFISFGDERIYPWLKPVPYGGAYAYFNEDTGTLASNVHVGAMALHQDSVNLFYVEQDRSRLLSLSNGLLGAAKTGHHKTPVRYGGFKDLFGRDMGRVTAQTHHPELQAGRRLERQPRRGPYFGVLFGSSMTSVTDIVGQYSMGRLMEEHLRRAFGLEDGVRFDLAQRAYRGPKFEQMLKGFGAFMQNEIPPDVVFFELHSGRLFSGMSKPKQMASKIARLLRAARNYDTLVVFLDNDAMTSEGRDGLRARSEHMEQFLELARDAGIVVISPSDELLRENLHASTWGSPPLIGPHGSVWAIDLTAEAFARLAYPAVREHLRDRKPAWRWSKRAGFGAKKALADAFRAVEYDWKGLAATVSVDAVTSQVDGRSMSLFVDLAKTGDDAAPSDDRIEELMVAYLARMIGTDPMGAVVAKVRIELARFDNYDEYGVGMLEAAQTVAAREYDVAALQDALKAFVADHPD